MTIVLSKLPQNTKYGYFVAPRETRASLRRLRDYYSGEASTGGGGNLRLRRVLLREDLARGKPGDVETRTLLPSSLVNYGIGLRPKPGGYESQPVGGALNGERRGA